MRRKRRPYARFGQQENPQFSGDDDGGQVARMICHEEPVGSEWCSRQ